MPVTPILLRQIYTIKFSSSQSGVQSKSEIKKLEEPRFSLFSFLIYYIKKMYLRNQFHLISTWRIYRFLIKLNIYLVLWCHEQFVQEPPCHLPPIDQIPLWWWRWSSTGRHRPAPNSTTASFCAQKRKEMWENKISWTPR